MNKIPDGAASLSKLLKKFFDQIVQAGMGPEELLKSVLENTASLCQAAAGSIRLHDKKSGRLLLAAAYSGDNKQTCFKAAVGTIDSAEGKVFTEQKTCFSEDIPVGIPAFRPGKDMLFYTGIPVTSRGWKLGVFSMYFSGRRKFSEKEMESLSLIINFLAGSAANRMLELEVSRSRLDMAKVLIKVMEEKDLYTMGHSERVRNYAVKIGKRLNMPDEEFKLLSEFSILHDIGKITIDSNILNTPGKLSKDQWTMVQQHPLIGERILSSIDGFTASIPLIKHHHERLDGGGYPEGLKGEEIPLLARIIAVCDSFDAMVSKRAYRDALAVAKAKDELLKNTGSQFDEKVVNIMVELIDSGGTDFFEGQREAVEINGGRMRHETIQDNEPYFSANLFQTYGPPIGSEASQYSE